MKKESYENLVCNCCPVLNCLCIVLHLRTKTHYVCLSVCMLPMAGRTAGPIKKTKLGTGTHVDPRSVLVKVKVIYLCVRYNSIHDSDTWRTTMKHVRRSNSAVAGATW